MTTEKTGGANLRYTRRRAAVAALFVCALLGAYILYVVDPNRQALLPCLLFKFTGLYCPGCGNTRALHALLHGDILTAISMNAFTVLIALPLGVVLALSYLPIYLGFKPIIPRVPLGARAALVFTVAMLLFGVLRNIPLFAFLAPGRWR